MPGIVGNHLLETCPQRNWVALSGAARSCLMCWNRTASGPVLNFCLVVSFDCAGRGNALTCSDGTRLCWDLISLRLLEVSNVAVRLC